MDPPQARGNLLAMVSHLGRLLDIPERMPGLYLKFVLSFSLQTAKLFTSEQKLSVPSGKMRCIMQNFGYTSLN